MSQPHSPLSPDNAPTQAPAQAQRPFDPLINKVLESRYRIDEEVGRGGMGVVYRGTDLTLSRAVAIKTILHQEANDEALERFVNEARTLAKIETQRMVPVYAVGQDEGYHYIVMKLLEGETLADLMRREGQLPPEHVVNICAQVCEALHALHERGIIHRDIKPANLMISPEGAVTVMDLGIAKSVEELATGSTAVGTPRYMPPEAIDSRPLDARADLYSLAVIAFHALAGEPPFDGPTPMSILYKQAHTPPPSLRALAPLVSKELEGTIERALKKSPDERFQNALAFREALKGRSAQGSPGPSSKVPYLIAALALLALGWALLLRPQPITKVKINSSDLTPRLTQPQAGTQQAQQAHQANNTQANNTQANNTQANNTQTGQGKSTPEKTSKPPKKRVKMVRLRVSSQPSNALIYHQGKRLGKTPTTLEKPASESWSLTLKLKGFKASKVTLKRADVRVKITTAFSGGF